METNFLQVGEMTACGHCQPDKFQAVEPCDCKCHEPLVESGEGEKEV